MVRSRKSWSADLKQSAFYRLASAITIASLLLSLVGAILPPPSAQAGLVQAPPDTGTPTATPATASTATSAPTGTATSVPTSTATTVATATATAIPAASPTSVPATATAVPATATPIVAATATAAGTASPSPTLTSTPTPTPLPTAVVAGARASAVEMGASGGTLTLSTAGSLAVPSGALTSPLRIGYVALDRRFAPGLGRYHPAGRVFRIEAFGPAGDPLATSFKAPAAVRFEIDGPELPPALAKAPALRRQTAKGWESLPSARDGSGGLVAELRGLPATLVLVDSSREVSTTALDPTDPAALQLPDGYWAMAAVDDSGNLIWMKTTSANSSTYWAPPSTVEPSALMPALVRLGSTLGLFYGKSDGAVRQVYLRTSTDGGATWSAPVQLTSETANVYQVQASLAGGVAYVFWSRSDASGLLQYRTSTDLASWTPAASVGQAIGPLSADRVRPEFDVKRLSSGLWALAWNDYHPSQPTWDGYNGLWYASSADLGSTSWGNKQVLNLDYLGER